MSTHSRQHATHPSTSSWCARILAKTSVALLVLLFAASAQAATITATSQENGGKSVTHSTGAGVFTFPDLPLGSYTVTVSAQGFQTKTSTGVLVQVNGTTALNVSLGSGAVSESVTVDASGLQLQTESSDIGARTAKVMAKVTAETPRRSRANRARNRGRASVLYRVRIWIT